MAATQASFANSNIALLGSDIEHRVREQAAGTEPAWQHAGKRQGLEIWRIENFKVVPWLTSHHELYDGDSYASPIF